MAIAVPIKRSVQIRVWGQIPVERINNGRDGSEKKRCGNEQNLRLRMRRGFLILLLISHLKMNGEQWCFLVER